MSDKTVKDVLMELLCEIRDICNENNIVYSLYGSTSAKALTTNDIDEPFASIMVGNDDFVRLCKLMENKHIKHRSFDSMHNNPKYMDYSARYSNTETTNISLAQKGNIFKSGIYVEIIPLRMENNTRFKHNFIRFLEHGWEKHFCKLTSVRFKYLLTVPFINILKLVVGKKRVARFIFNKMAEYHGGSFVNTSSIKSFNHTLPEFSFDPLHKTKIVRVNGKNFAVSSKITVLLRRVYSRVWRKKALTTTAGQNNIVLLDVSCKELERTFKRHNNVWKKYFRKKSRQMFVKTISSYYDRQKKKVWTLARRTGTRARLYFYYMPKMGLIRNLLENEDYYRLSSVMRLNRLATLLAYKQGSGFAVNKELFDIQLKLFRFEGNIELANRLETMTPKYYMNPIVDNEVK
ncbi:MAG: hypothetical protein IJV39_02280 [Ruminococcus sp.]|nr:hypothetical protein [Ruminococcus sp.]